MNKVIHTNVWSRYLPGVPVDEESWAVEYEMYQYTTSIVRNQTQTPPVSYTNHPDNPLPWVVHTSLQTRSTQSKKHTGEY